jgi:hypothetical protein
MHAQNFRSSQTTSQYNDDDDDDDDDDNLQVPFSTKVDTAIPTDTPSFISAIFCSYRN